MKTYKFIYSIVFYTIFLTSCVSHKASYRGEWERLAAVDNPYYTLYLIGDAGYAPLGESTIVFEHLKKQLDQESESSAIIWLGDNIYPVGLAPTNSVYHAQGRHRLMAQLRTMSDYKGQKYFVPGNHDWYTYGRVGLRRQELLVDSFLLHTPNPHEQNNYFLPDKGCGDPKAHSLIEGISLLTMDSHWFLNEKSRSGDQSVCEVKTPEEFIEKLQSEISNQSENTLIVASHHPPYTYAHHGGKFPIKDDIFPLTQKINWLYIPLPMAGYLFNRMRLRISEQDVYHPLYKLYKRKLEEALQSKGSSIVASGHEHTLQLVERNDQFFIVSGAGTKNNKVAIGRGSKFAIGEKGYVKIVFMDSNRAILQFLVPGQYKAFNNIAFEKMVFLK